MRKREAHRVRRERSPLCVLSTASAAFAAPETFQFDKNHTLVGFRIRHFVSKVEGRFKDFEGTIVARPAESRRRRGST